jgi:hypothetical protein
MTSDDISQMFDGESQKLNNLISTANSKTDLSIHEIVETYYQVMNISSMATMLKEQAESESLLDKIQVTEKLISKQFNSDIHPKIMEKLSVSIQETTKKLQSGNTGEKSKEEIESEAKLFEELRQKMSTREFVEQYDKGLSHD